MTEKFSICTKKLNKDYLSFTTKISKNNDEILKKLTSYKDFNTDIRINKLLSKNDTITKIDKLLEEAGIKEELQSLSECLSENATPFLLKYDFLIKQKEKLDEIENLLKIKKSDIEKQRIELKQQEIELKEEDLYNRMRVFKSQNHSFIKIITILCIILLSIFVGCLTSSIKKRIEYNPYERVEEKNFVINELHDIDEQNNFK